MSTGGPREASRTLFFWLGAAALLPMWQFVGGREIYFLNDVLHWYFAAQRIVGRILEAAPSALPLWNPYSFSGCPLAADPQAHVWYPPAVLYRILPYPAASGCFLSVHLFLAIAGMAVFLRDAGARPRAAVLGAVAFGFSGHASVLLAKPAAASAYAWLPWMAVFASRLAARWRPADAVALGIAGGWLVLAGAPAYLGPAAVLAAAVGLGGKAEAGARPDWRLAAAAVAVAALAAAALLLPFIGYSLETGRGLLRQFVAAGGDPMPAWMLLGLLAPATVLPRGEDVVGAAGLWTSFHYAGILAVALALTGVGLMGWRRVPRTALGLVGGGIALGAGGGLLRAMGGGVALGEAVSGLWMILALFGIAWLAAVGADELERRLGTREGDSALKWWIVAAVFLGGMSFGARLWSFGVLREWVREGHGTLAAVMAVRMGETFWPAMVIAAATLILWLASRREIRVRHAMAALAVLIWGDLAVVTRNHVQPHVRAEWFMRAPAAEEFLKERRGFFRVFVAPRLQNSHLVGGLGRKGAVESLRASMKSNLAAAAGIRDADGRGLMRPGRMDRLLGEARLAASPRAEPAARVFGLLGVKYLVSSGVLADPGYRLVHEGLVRIYERAGTPRPAWVEPPGTGSVAGEARIAAGAWDLSVELERPATVVVSETWMPGWRLTAGPAGACVGPVHGALIGVELPKGRHALRLRYRPFTAYAGLGISLVALLVLAVWGTCLRFCVSSGKRKNASTSPS